MQSMVVDTQHSSSPTTTRSSSLSYTHQSMQSMVVDTQHSSSPTTTSIIISIIHSPINAVNGCRHGTLVLSHNKCHHLYHTLTNQCSQWMQTRNTRPVPQQVSSSLSYTHQSMQSMVVDTQHSSSPTTTSAIISITHSTINAVNGCRHATLVLSHNKCHHLYHTLTHQCSQWLQTRNTLPLPQQVSSSLSYTHQPMLSMVVDTQHSSCPTTSVIISIIHSPINAVNGCRHATLVLAHNKCHHLYHTLANQCCQWLQTRNTRPLPQQVSSSLSYTRQSMQSMVVDTEHSSSPTTSVIISIIHSPINAVNGCRHATLVLAHNTCHHLYHTLTNQCSQWLQTRNTLPHPQQVSSSLSYTHQSMQSMVVDT